MCVNNEKTTCQDMSKDLCFVNTEESFFFTFDLYYVNRYLKMAINFLSRKLVLLLDAGTYVNVIYVI